MNKKPDLRNNCKGVKTHGLSKHPLYTVWRAVKNRCYNETFEQYKDYGGKGVVMCQEWLDSFQSFYDWCIQNGWKIGLQIDKDIKGDGLIYSPTTCCFVTAKENSNKRRSNVVVEYSGNKYNLKEVALKFGFNYKLLSERMKKGWSFEKTINTPVIKNQHSFA